MKVLIVGGGGREHAIALALSRSPRVEKLWCAPGNGGIAALAECVPVKATDLDGILDFCRKSRPDLVVVAPDDPLVLGMVDLLEEHGFAAFGPRKSASVIEGSKSFGKDLMARYHIPTAACRIFDDCAPALQYVETCPIPVVVKADGLALGKGVFICRTRAEALGAVRSIMEDRLFGQAGARVVIEEFLTGPEVSVLCFTDGTTLVPMPAAQDHKRAFDGDRGPNTGGMGAFSPVSCYTPEMARRCMDEIFLPTMRAMKAENREFRGVLYISLMLTPDGPKVIEYNCRFGARTCWTFSSPCARGGWPRRRWSFLTGPAAASSWRAAATPAHTPRACPSSASAMPSARAAPSTTPERRAKTGCSSRRAAACSAFPPWPTR